MSENDTQICPWCQTEIVWDPEIGPEEVCPHCLNELGDYRSVSYHSHADEEEAAHEDEEEENSEIENTDYFEDEEPDPYQEKVQSIIDTQLEAPECPSCRELMLFGGQVRLSGQRFTPTEPAELQKPFLPEILEMDLYVCPSCFKTETYLAEPGRLRLTQTLSE
ncbi:hypothetical protein [Gorillibacterium timonense]|uniref:hypothetical protein n=1 Tax=Gorillibacterium timonense TaxID=1689269 RepID=UPI00071DB18A|nr:hypothetical protein [Gorillibacterium timonense]